MYDRCVWCSSKFAVALLLTSMSYKMRESEDCMCCIARMIDAYVVRVKFAIALLLISTSKNMQENIMACVCVIEVRCFEYGMYMFCVACMMFAVDFAVKACDSSPCHF